MNDNWEIAVENPERRECPNGKQYTVYSIRSSVVKETSTGAKDSEKFCVEKRFNDFVELRKILVLHNQNTKVPSLPPSQYTGRFKESFVQQRMHGLKAFLEEILNHPLLGHSEEVYSFLRCEHKALVYRSYGGIEKLELLKIPIPKLELPTDILIRVHAASINPADLKHRDGELKYLVKRNCPIGIGFDFSGVVVAVGNGVTEFTEGDEVFGDVRGLRTGTVAEYAVVDESIACRKPCNLSHVQAAGAPLAGMTALQCFSACHMPQRGSVLITAGAGGVGSYAIQIAKNFYHSPLVATTASSGGKTEFVCRLGADRVFDYRHEDVVAVCEREGLQFDCVIDCTGEAGRLVPLVKYGGGLVSILACPTGEMLCKWMDMSIGPGVSIAPIISGTVANLGNGINLFTGASDLSKKLAKEESTYKFIITTPNKDDISLLRDLLENGQVIPQIDSEWSLADAIEAAKKLETGRAAGKVIVRCVEEY